MLKISGQILGKKQYPGSWLCDSADEMRQSVGSLCREMCQYENVDKCDVGIEAYFTRSMPSSSPSSTWNAGVRPALVAAKELL
jgi:hypothetical protein